MKIFLGGTCNGSKWRETLIPLLNIEYFNPVVSNWTSECKTEEIKQRKECDLCLYVITPKMNGVYSIAEVIDDSNKRPTKTIFLPLESDGNHTFNFHQWESILSVSKMVETNGGKVFYTFEYLIDYIISMATKKINYIVTIKGSNGTDIIKCSTIEEVWDSLGKCHIGSLTEVESPTGKDVSEFIIF